MPKNAAILLDVGEDLGTHPTEGSFSRVFALLARLRHRQKQVCRPCRQRHMHLRSWAKPIRLALLHQHRHQAALHATAKPSHEIVFRKFGFFKKREARPSRRADAQHNKKKPYPPRRSRARRAGVRRSRRFFCMPSGHEKSRRRPTLAWAGPTLPSAMEPLTSVFGMGTGMTTPLWPPAKSREVGN